LQSTNENKEVFMKSALKMFAVIFIGLAFMTSTGFAGDPKYSGFLEGYYKNLKPGPEGGAKMLWVKTGTSIGKYDKFMIDSVIFYFADDSEYKGIDPQVMKDLSDGFNKAIVAAFKDKYPLVSEPGPDVARIRYAITGFKQSRPAISAFTTIMPVGLAVSVVKRGIAGSWTGSGATSGELMVMDSMTNDVIGVAVDERSAGFTERFSKWGSADEAFNFWAGRMVKFIDTEKITRTK
jgi:hypothetical protein